MRKQKHAALILIAGNHQLSAYACQSLLEPGASSGRLTDGRRLIAAATGFGQCATATVRTRQTREHQSLTLKEWLCVVALALGQSGLRTGRCSF